MRGPVIEIVWRDAQDHHETWVGEKDTDEFSEADCLVESIGYLIKETKLYLTIGSDWDPEDKNYGTVRKIPIAMIVKRSV